MSAAREALHAIIDELPEESLERVLDAIVDIDGPLPPEDEAGIRRGLDAVQSGAMIDGADAFARLDAILQRRVGRG